MNTININALAAEVKEIRQKVDRIRYSAAGGTPINVLSACQIVIASLRKVEDALLSMRDVAEREAGGPQVLPQLGRPASIPQSSPVEILEIHSEQKKRKTRNEGKDGDAV